jgi:hypothetical protein
MKENRRNKKISCQEIIRFDAAAAAAAAAVAEAEAELKLIVIGF